MKRKSLLIIAACLWAFSFFRSSRSRALLIRGDPGSRDFRVFLTKNGESKSFWHDLNFRASEAEVNMVVEIPRLSREKMEIHKTENHTPIFQDVRHGNLRFLHAPLSWHYGSVPQTVGDDGDPLDILDVTDVDRKLGDVVAVKVLGALPLLDEGKLDWKIIAIAEDSSEINSLDDLEISRPGVVSGVVEFFRWYDFPETRKPNVYAGSPLGREKTWELITRSHEDWKRKFGVSKVVL